MRYLLSAFVLMLCFVSIGIAQPQIYFVDYKLLVGLHPRMGGYDIVLERFLRSDINFADSNELNEINLRIASASMEANRKVEELQRQLDRFFSEKSRIENIMSGRKVEFNEDLGRYDGDGSRKQRNRKIAEIDRDIEGIERKIEKIWDEVMNPLYISRQQSKKVVRSVLDEIDLMLQQFSTQLGNAMIIDSNYLGQELQPQRVSGAPSVGGDPLSIRLYQSLLNSDLIGDVPEPYRRDPELRAYASRMRADIEESFDRNIAMQISKQPLYGKLPGFRGRFILAGPSNLDLTRQVLEKIFLKHGVRQDIAARILAQVK